VIVGNRIKNSLDLIKVKGVCALLVRHALAGIYDRVTSWPERKYVAATGSPRPVATLNSSKRKFGRFAGMSGAAFWTKFSGWTNRKEVKLARGW
jgi:hypothetical protein